jgi:micrococcal nuclease
MAWPRRRTGYGRVIPTHRWQGLSRWQRLWAALRWWLGAALLVLVMWLVAQNWPGRIAPAAMPSGPAEVVTGPFVRCGAGRAGGCVPDGDTLIIGTRKIRIIGIDAPELHPARCPAEAAQGEAAAQALLALLNQGPFTLAGPTPVVRDEYGRELRHLLRARPDGAVQSIADDLVATGTVRAYLHGSRDPWC